MRVDPMAGKVSEKGRGDAIAGLRVKMQELSFGVVRGFGDRVVAKQVCRFGKPMMHTWGVRFGFWGRCIHPVTARLEVKGSRSNVSHMVGTPAGRTRWWKIKKVISGDNLNRTSIPNVRNSPRKCS
jgi:hypothetical protein